MNKEETKSKKVDVVPKGTKVDLNIEDEVLV